MNRFQIPATPNFQGGQLAEKLVQLKEELPRRIIEENSRLSRTTGPEAQSEIRERVAHYKLTLFSLQQAIAKLQSYGSR